MVDLEAIPEVTEDRIAAIGPVDAVVGLTDCANGTSLRSAVDAIHAAQSKFAAPVRTLILHPDTTGEALDYDTNSSIVLTPLPAWRPDPTPDATIMNAQAILAIATAGRRLNARACCVWNSAADALTPAAAHWFLHSVASEGFDLAVPRYTQPRFGTLINSGITAPLTRTLYGLRIPYPQAPDFCCSPRVVDELLRPDPKSGRPRRPQWLPIQATCQGLKLCLVELGTPPPTIAGAGDLSSVLSLILGSLFQEIEQNASFWQRARASRPLPRFGEAGRPPEELGGVEVQGLIEGFQLAYRNLGEVWGLVLPPATLLELKKLTRLSAADFRLADPVWARIVFDFVLAQRQRVMNRDHLLRALTPIYLAWVASFANEVSHAPAAHATNRLEQLDQAFESQKSYLLSRWRWPDRFNP